MLRGVIEGFYGKAWSWQERLDLLAFLQRYGFSRYVYAPKSDVFLRRLWQHDWPVETRHHLMDLSEQAKQNGIAFGLGLSPLSLVNQWDSSQRQQLQKKLKQLKNLKPDMLAILFDDQRFDISSLAHRQAEIMDFVAQCLPDVSLAMCPTYYSFDVLLSELFGAVPDDYWPTLGEKVPKSVDILWTGENVISEQYSLESLNKINALLKRKVLIWDNSRVSDGRKTSPFLPLKASFDFTALEAHSQGVLINPMNPVQLAKIHLASVSFTGEKRLQQAIKTLEPELYQALLDSLPLFNEKGLDALSDHDKNTLQQRFAASNHATAKQIIAWLHGEYRFDPGCLT